ncbi:Nn.00g089150.m01.CDS01 [Neocucurbitaria sp. VM-36]
MSWMDSWSRPSKHAVTPPPLYLTVGDTVPYCHSCGRVIGERRKQGATEVKYCSARCRNSKPGPVDRKIEATFAALLDGKTPEELRNGDVGKEQEKGSADEAKRKKHSKKGSKSMKKGDHRIIVECGTVEEIVFVREKDPEKVYGRRKNRKARFVVEKPEDWRSVDMVDEPTSTPTAATTTTSATSSSQPPPEFTSDSETLSDSDGEQEGGIVLESTSTPTQDQHADEVAYGYGSGKIRPPQSQNDVNGSVGGEKGWAERSEETDEMKAKRREGQRRADEREMVRKAARRGCAFGFAVEGEEGKKKCEAVMKGVVVEASFAKGEWGVRWREKF